jgi:hypothetical protein
MDRVGGRDRRPGATPVRIRVALVTMLIMFVPLVGCGRIPSGDGSPSSRSNGSSAQQGTASPEAGDEDSSFSFDDIASYTSGLEVEIAGAVAQQATTGMTGAETTRGQMAVVSVLIRNGAEDDLDASIVLVTAASGPEDVEAPLVTDPSGELANAFNGAITPGQEATADFGFAIPVSALSRVTVTVDLGDGTHEPVSFSGAVARDR